LVGAGWDSTSEHLCESAARSPIFSFPPIWLQPVMPGDVPSRRRTTAVIGKAQAAPEVYHCPLYQDISRRGTDVDALAFSLANGLVRATGAAESLLIVDLPSVRSEDYWALRGAALFCQVPGLDFDKGVN
jgi:hypothetical protein